MPQRERGCGVSGVAAGEVYRDLVDHLVIGTEAVGATVMMVGGAVVLLRAAGPVIRRSVTERSYRALRRDLGRVVLVGLEILIVADIVRTIVVSTDLNGVALLGAIVAIRTVLSLSLDVEIDGALPWRRTDETSPPPSP